MDHIRTSTATGILGTSSMILYITSDRSTTGTVELADGSFNQTFVVTANAVTMINIPANAFVGTQGQFLKGIHIKSATPIAVYAHIYASSVSGATLLLPVSALGKDYMSINYTQVSNSENGQNPEGPSYSTFAVVATEDNTTVEITPSQQLLNGEAKGVKFTVNLRQGEIYQGLSKNDLTGTRIKSVSAAAGVCKRIAVFSGSTKLGIACSPRSPLSSDNLFQQVYATATWGKNYVTAPLRSRRYDIYRIILSDPLTQVLLNGAPIPANLFTDGVFYEFSSTTTNFITSDKPIQVVQYAVTQNEGVNCVRVQGDIGDPEMIYLSPIEQGLDRVTVYSSGYYNILASYINVILPTSAVASFTLDGIPYTSFAPIVGHPEYSYAQIPVSSGPSITGAGSVTSGTHNLHADKPFNAIAYGFGNAESYGYAAGTNQLDLNTNLVLTDPADDTKLFTAVCSGTMYKLKLTLPYKTPRIRWDVGNGTAMLTQTNPIITSTKTTNGQTLYTYEYPGNVFYPAGSFTATATVFNPVADDCGSDREIQFFFESSAPPAIDVSMPAFACLNNEINFKGALLTANGPPVKAWLWSFGDNTTSPLQNPSHVFTMAGDYNVSVTIFDINGCSSTITKPIHINKPPLGAFNVVTDHCAGENVLLTDNSVANEGVINSRKWDFGDGSPIIELTSSASFGHVFATAGVYTITLTISTDKGCSSVYSKTITIHPRPLVDFSLPDACLDDVAKFIDKSTIEDNTETEFKYLWNFGDMNSPTANNISDQKNAQHKYRAAGIYTVSLTVTSKYGCVNTKQMQFTVNGATPVARFEVQNNCSGSDIVFKDLSTPSFGNITKLIWFFDYDNHPEIFETDTMASMHPDKLYTHYYGLFNTPVSKKYHVKLIAYSGESQTCANVFDDIVTIYANPVITLSYNSQPVNTGIVICNNGGAIKINDDKGIYQGAGAFSGKGISQNGRFDPVVAGTGTFTINYVFTANTTGCTYTQSFQIIVNPSPVIQDDNKYVLLEGEKLLLRPTVSLASGTMTYSWTPSITLDNADVARPYASPTENTMYTLTVTSNKGCISVKSIFVNVLKTPVIPNAFTPNSDGINDTWQIKHIDMYPQAKVDIFSRSGEKVYSSKGYSVPWDGTSHGAALPTGTYYYIIDPGSGRRAASGYVSIIK